MIEAEKNAGNEPSAKNIEMLSVIKTKYLNEKPGTKSQIAKNLKQLSLANKNMVSDNKGIKKDSNQDMDAKTKEKSTEAIVSEKLVDQGFEKQVEEGAKIIKSVSKAAIFNYEKSSKWSKSWVINLEGKNSVSDIVSELWYEGRVIQQKVLYSHKAKTDDATSMVYFHIKAIPEMLFNISGEENVGTQTTLVFAISQDAKSENLIKQGKIFIKNIEEAITSTYQSTADSSKTSEVLYSLSSAVDQSAKQVIKINKSNR